MSLQERRLRAPVPRGRRTAAGLMTEGAVHREIRARPCLDAESRFIRADMSRQHIGGFRSIGKKSATLEEVDLIARKAAERRHAIQLPRIKRKRIPGCGVVARAAFAPAR